jgi:hypothetical protein
MNPEVTPETGIGGSGRDRFYGSAQIGPQPIQQLLITIIRGIHIRHEKG